jgi:putative intracellular protease/amidase
MRNAVRAAASTLISFALALVLQAPLRAEGQHWVCDPCGLPCDEIVYDHPGNCPKCGMPLVDQEKARHEREATARTQKKVAILIFDGVEIIDYTGPWEVFGAAGFDVYTVAGAKDAITTAMGMTVLPRYTFADAPQPDILVVPGGGVTAARNSAPTLKWLTDTTARTSHTMSVCNGAFILASAGLLDGLTATTTSGNIARLKAEYPKTKVVDDQRFVDNGKIITTAGLSAGIDGALHVVSLELGPGMAQKVALAEEYDWRPRTAFARAALADRLIPQVDMDALGTWTVLDTEGTRERWEMVIQGRSDLSAAEVMDRIGRDLAAKGKWTSVAPAAGRPPSAETTRWTFTGRDGKPWNGTVTIQASPTEAHVYTAKLTIAQAG